MLEPSTQAGAPATDRLPGGRHVLTILGADPVERLAAFYEAVFGWPRHVDVGVYVEFGLPDGRGLGIYRRDILARIVGRPLAVPAEGTVSGAELYFHCQDLEAAIARMEATGATRLSALAVRDWGDEAAYYADPQGNIVVLARRVADGRPPLQIRPVTEADHTWIAQRSTAIWGAPVVVSCGHLHEPARLPGFVAEEAGQPVGLLSYRIEGDEAEIVTLDAFERWQGIGTRLLAAAEAHLRTLGCRRVWLVTTNDNLSALRFYQRRGYTLTAVRAGALEESRRLKPGIPLIGEHGVPLRDELILEKRF